MMDGVLAEEANDTVRSDKNENGPSPLPPLPHAVRRRRDDHSTFSRTILFSRAPSSSSPGFASKNSNSCAFSSRRQPPPVPGRRRLSSLSPVSILPILIVVLLWCSIPCESSSSSSPNKKGTTPTGAAHVLPRLGNRREDMCRSYVMGFLNGTTDARDECEGLLNAYRGADCKDELINGRVRSSSSSASGSGAPDTEGRASAEAATGTGTGEGGVAVGTGGGVIGGDPSSILDDVTSFASWRRRFLAMKKKKKGEEEGMQKSFWEGQCCRTIKSYYGRHCKSHEFANESGATDWKYCGVAAILVLCGIVRGLIRKYRVHFLPEAAGIIVVGVVVGGLMHWFGAAVFSMESHDYFFNDDVFLGILLPPIVFSAAIGINKAAFRRFAFPIFAFAVLGTIASSVLTGVTIHSLSSVSSSVTTIPELDAYIFGALISSIDPVAILSVLGNLGMTDADAIYVVIFGESLLNDGVAIVLFQTLVGYLATEGEGPDASSLGLDGHQVLWRVCWNFLFVSVSSLVIGVFAGACCAMYYWTFQGYQHPVVEVALFFCWAWIPYYIANALRCSGIVALVATGFVMDIFVIGQGRPTTTVVASTCGGTGSALPMSTFATGPVENGNGHHQQLRQGADDDDGRCATSVITRSLFDGGETHGSASVASSVSAAAAPDHFPLPDGDEIEAAQSVSLLSRQSSNPIILGGRPRPLWTRLVLLRGAVFSREGHMSGEARRHVKFVAEVLANLAETAIFAYLGTFLFGSKYRWDVRLNLLAIVASVSSRLVMVVSVALFMKTASAAWTLMSRWFCRGEYDAGHRWTRGRAAPSGEGQYNWDAPDERDQCGAADAEDSPVNVVFNPKTQYVLVLAGLRGAVSFALVENIPLYNIVTDSGSKYKPELKAMTSSVILFTVFLFGGATHYVVQRLRLVVRRGDNTTSATASRSSSPPRGGAGGDTSMLNGGPAI